MRNGRETIWDVTESGRIIEYAFDRLLAEDYNAIVALLVGKDDTTDPESKQALRQTRAPSTNRYNLPSRDGLRIARSQTLSTVIRDGAINNGPTIDAFPCIEHEKKIREPF
jgi:hypothetical protein